MVLLNSLSF
uniref:Uncharacterized protein n=1 Tax=Rhizophora mucronata TaxID=61149 RepID=A0A2P2P0R1_RHIMU